MKKTLKIGWQKYEDFVEKQLSSPLMNIIMEHVSSKMSAMAQDMEDDDEHEEEAVDMHGPLMVPLSAQLMDDLAMLSNFDCWIGHTNFDITPKVKDKLDSVEGIELLKVCSRYRFFIGIGNMFDFKEVRKNIEKAIIPKGETE